MNGDQFNNIINEQLDYCKNLLTVKDKEYTHGSDRLRVFKAAAAIQDESPKEALAGMMAKHTISIYDMCAGGDYPLDKWTEKITDHINYLLLLKAMVIEEDNIYE